MKLTTWLNQPINPPAMIHVILYYNFAKIENPPKFRADHKRKCEALNLMGRVYISHEGINGTLAGTKENIDAYKDFLWEQDGFAKTEFKEDIHEEMPFVKLIVKLRDEIVALKSDEEIDLTKESGKHLSPEEWKKVLDENKDITLIDVRNNYESKVGHFEGAIQPDVKNFYDFPKWLEDAKLDKDKKVLMYCTGGIRCEKFSVLMEKKGFKDVQQLQGGIINYAQKVGDDHYKGKCFVFDDRLTVPIEKNQKEALTKCEITGEPSDRFLNCADPDCNRLFICSEEGAKQMQGACSEKCKQSKRLRPFDPNNIYEPTRKWYHYWQEKKTS